MALEVGTNSYVTVAEADAYFAERYGYDQWAGQTPEQKEAALISAAGALDATCAWYGYPVSKDQPMAFPRNPHANPTPQAIKDAQCELAYSMVAAGSANVGSEDPLTRLKAGDVELEFKGVGGKTNSLYNDHTKNLLRPYGTCHYGTGAQVVDVMRA